MTCKNIKYKLCPQEVLTVWTPAGEVKRDPMEINGIGVSGVFVAHSTTCDTPRINSAPTNIPSGILSSVCGLAVALEHVTFVKKSHYTGIGSSYCSLYTTSLVILPATRLVVVMCYVYKSS
ncbi:hypothetical protein KQX54_005667 [Cotesia glomerata]|uniref:Uncharacterized protein n=1 Tax=Cotesia glomerata TaxID=32391 RepID=A0AAV7J4Z3_COTGL|nr:hypothetical protein KQX54_005667 [Cotesia glomerata]